MHILLVEDHHDSLEAMRIILVKQMHDVAVATTLKDAIRQCLKDKYDVVLCDIGLPDGDGWGLAQVARECGCPAIAVTGYGMPSDIAKAREVGFAEHLLKPFIVADLLAAIARVTATG